MANRYFDNSQLAEAVRIASGDTKGVSHINKFGFNNTVPTDWELISVVSENLVYATTASVAGAVSDDATDDLTGTGARTVKIQGVDANYDLLTETVDMDGTDSAVTTGEFLRIFRASVETAGTNGTAAGNIDITLGSDIQGRIDTDYDNQTLQCNYTVPAGKTAYIKRFQSTSTKDNKAALVGIFTRPPGGVFKVKQMIEMYRNTVTVDFPIPLEIPEKTDIEVRGKNLNTGQISIGASFDLILVDN